tara:strand:+ start:641 stop:1270 length:630 start_codon:yes stop_codon:yes gene_type:complete
MASYASIRYNFDPPSATTSAQVGAGVLEHIKTTTISSSTGNVSFIHGTSDVVFDNTYHSYLFKIIELHPDNDDGARLGFTGTTDGSAFDGITNNSNYVQVVKEEGDGYEAVAYDQYYDIADGTGIIPIWHDIGNDNDQNATCELWIGNPSQTNFFKPFFSHSTCTQRAESVNNPRMSGVLQTTSAVTGVRFSLNTGNIDSATFKLYGIK